MTTEEARGYLKDLMAVYSAAVVLTAGRTNVGPKMTHIMRELEEVRITKRYVKLLVDAERRGESLPQWSFYRLSV